MTTEKDKLKMNKQKLKIGLLLDDYHAAAWFYEIVRQIVESEYAEIQLVVMNQAPSEPRPPFYKRIWRNRGMIGHVLYRKFEDKVYRTSPNVFEQKDLSEMLDCETIKVIPKRTKFSDRFESEDIEAIKKHDIDIFLRMGFRILRGEILNLARYGIWSYHHGDNAVNRGGPAGLWEVLEGWDETGVILQILSEDLDGGLILEKSYSCTDSLSINRNLHNYYWKAATFIPRQLKTLYEMGETAYFEKIKTENAAPYFYYNSLYRTPKNTQLLRKLMSLYAKKIKGKIGNIFYFNQWQLLFKLNKKSGISTSFFRFKRILPPKDRFWADPFIIYKNEKYYIFLEELLYKTNKGHIAVIEMDEKGKYTEPQTVLERDYHLSYPFLIEDTDELYMIPETMQNNNIELYKCVDFPLKWEFEQTLIADIAAVDATVLKKDDTYWLFANVKAHPAASMHDELCLFYADSLTGEWTAHPQNPIVSDVKTARPAGKIFKHKDKFYRPAQNCSKHYGYGMQICEIKTLTKEQYEETNVQSIYPNWAKDFLSTHTLNADGKLTVIDALIRRRK